MSEHSETPQELVLPEQQAKPKSGLRYLLNKLRNPDKGQVDQSRREFLKNMGKGLAAAAVLENPLVQVAAQVSEPLLQTPETESSEVHPALFVDIPHGLTTDQLLEVFGDEMELPEDFTDADRAMLHSLIEHYVSNFGDHAQMTMSSHEEALRRLGADSENAQAGELVPATNFIHTPRVFRREDGGISLRFVMDPQQFSQRLNDYKGVVVNASLQWGEQGADLVNEIPGNYPEYRVVDDEGGNLFYIPVELIGTDRQDFPVSIIRDDGTTVMGYQNRDGTTIEGMNREEFEDWYESYPEAHKTKLDRPEMRVVEAYNPELAEQNLRALIQLCKDHPDKLIITAAGNSESFFAEARQSIIDSGEEWPENLLLVGVDYGDQKLVQDGADILVMADQGMEGNMRGSSEASDIVSALAQTLVNEGITDPKTIRDMILSDFATRYSVYPNRYREQIPIRRLHPLDQINIDAVLAAA